MELGIIQTAWVEYLEANPDLKGIRSLGTFDAVTNKWTMCCLGGLLMSECERLGTAPIHRKVTATLFLSQGTSTESSITRLEDYDIYGLRSGLGGLNKLVEYEGEEYSSLAEMNDRDSLTWPQIAKFIRENPEIVFTKSV